MRERRQAPGRRATPSHSPESATETLAVLLVEDDDDDFELTSELLRRARHCVFDVTWTATFDAAVEALANAPYDVVLVDHMLGHRSGLELLVEARRLGTTAPMLILTGLDGFDVDLRAMESGAADFLVKGRVDAVSLERAIRYAVARQRSANLERRLASTERLASIGQLASGVAHEISNPAAVIMGNLEPLRDHLSLARGAIERGRSSMDESHPCRDEAALVEEGLSDAIDILEENRAALARISEIVRQLSMFWDVQREEIAAIELNALVNVALEMFTPQVPKRVRLKKALSVVPEFSGDPGRIVQCLMNLLANAARAVELALECDSHASRAHHIQVSTHVDETHITLRVEDTGCGVDPDVQARIFDPFFTTEEVGRAKGLGLAICAQTARMHNGALILSSTSGEGSCFELKIPRDTGLRVAALA